MVDYFTLDNRCCPFKVTITDDNIKVFNYTTNILLYSFDNPVDYFVAKSPWCNHFYVDATYDGNNILIRPKKELKYYLISDSIYVFNTDTEIKHFVSHIGNNLVPYAYAMSENKIYLISFDHKEFETSSIDTDLLDLFKSGSESPYTNYYRGDFENIEQDMKISDVYYRQHFKAPAHPEFGGKKIS